MPSELGLVSDWLARALILGLEPAVLIGPRLLDTHPRMEESTRSFAKPLARDPIPAGWNSSCGGFACGIRSFVLTSHMTELTGRALPAIALSPVLAYLFGFGSLPVMLFTLVFLYIVWAVALFTTF